MSMPSSVKIWYKRAAFKFLIAPISFSILISLLSPVPEFSDPTCTVIDDFEGNLLGASIATDGQWRFPHNDSIPLKFRKCILAFEDKYFDFHPGLNPVSLFRALRKNVVSDGRREGGSTITMQVARMIRKGRERTYFQKIIEIVLAFHFEINLSKEEILAEYVSNAPFGGNVVGLDAAAWRYYGRWPNQLSWAESAVLAVLPNAPSLIYPGKRQEALQKKRDRLLDQLYREGSIDSLTCYLSKQEILPGKPKVLPRDATHALNYLHKHRRGLRTATSLHAALQTQLLKIVNTHARELSFNEIHNAAAIVLDTRSGEILAYVGNCNINNEHGNQVDVIRAARSTGSILKPILYSAMLTLGAMTTRSLLTDIPTQIAGYSPKNYYLSYDGAVHSDDALYRSLNVPFVRMLREYGVDRFHGLLKRMGMSTLKYTSNHYGLSLILGGAEARLVDLVSIYAGMARVIMRHAENGTYDLSDYHGSSLLTKERVSDKEDYLINAAAAYLTFETLTKLKRPIGQAGWKSFSSSKKIAWKTGTSFGNRDAWAIGVTPEYTVGVWVGNADGEGRPGLTGVSAAGPVLFDIFNVLPATTWFNPPFDDLERIRICRESGFKFGNNCENPDTLLQPVSSLKSKVCQYHRIVHLDSTGRYQVNADCELPGNIVNAKWFVLSPVQEWYYRKKAPLYKSIPPLRADCRQEDDQHPMEFIYPRDRSKVYIPKELSGERGRVVFEIAHRVPAKKVYWHLDDTFIGLTQDFHQLAINTSAGEHLIFIIDEDGNELYKRLTVLNKD